MSSGPGLRTPDLSYSVFALVFDLFDLLVMLAVFRLPILPRQNPVAAPGFCACCPSAWDTFLLWLVPFYHLRLSAPCSERPSLPHFSYMLLALCAGHCIPLPCLLSLLTFITSLDFSGFPSASHTGTEAPLEQNFDLFCFLQCFPMPSPGPGTYQLRSKCFSNEWFDGWVQT